ncbi:MAG: helix-turn-helix domain-containing protein [Polyangiaceae bacterium]|nr:helix-turn-helix domain-containing protein [Polyangiaceae bacterium]
MRLLAGIAVNIEERRAELAMTVRELAEKSGVSERFLVKVHTGAANISVVRLAEIAQALDVPISALLPHEKLSNMFRRVTVDERGGIVSLIGLRGGGKSTIGARAAERLGIPFIELDERIAARAGMPAGEIFDMHGADFYRKVEREELDEILATQKRAIVATAGSLVTQSATFERLLAATTVVWLKATPQDHFDRVIAQGDTRPMRNRDNAMQELEGILRARRALHERAHHIIDTSALGLAKSVDRVVRLARANARVTY